MERYKRFYGIAIFLLTLVALLNLSFNIVAPRINRYNSSTEQLKQREEALAHKKNDKITVENKLKKIKDSRLGSVKKIYSPLESDLGNDTLFFTLYNDIIEMVHSNSIKIKALNYSYNPESDEFVKFGKDTYFVCDINMELVSNYINLGKLIQDLYQYPYYIKINEIEVKPYNKDKKILLTNMSIRLYSKTEPATEEENIQQ